MYWVLTDEFGGEQEHMYERPTAGDYIISLKKSVINFTSDLTSIYCKSDNI